MTISDETDIDRGQLLELFRTEALELLEEMERELLDLENHPDAVEPLNTAFRVAHTVKGNAWFLELGSVTELAHQAEDVLDALRKGTLTANPDLVTLLLRTADALRDLVSACTLEATPELGLEHRELMAVLAACVPAGESIAPLRGKLLVETVAPAPAGVEPAAAPRAERRRTLRVDIDKLDAILDLVGEIAIARGRLTRVIEDRASHDRAEVLETHREADRLYMELQEQVMKVRMVPIGPLFRQFNRAVRDLADELGRPTRLEISGGDVEVDMTLVEHLRDPLTHLVRNAVHHGIEAPEARRAAGKPAEGVVRLEAHHDAGSIVIQVTDDGHGIDPDRLRRKARETNLREAVDDLTDEEVLDLVFEPGFTTAREVTDVSGRGVGMDVVRRNAEALRGTAAIASVLGQGTTVTLRLPLTLAIIQGLSVGVDGETYIVPLDYVVECVELPTGSRRHSDGKGVTFLRGSALPYLHLSRFFRLDAATPARENIVVLRHGDFEAGLAVDQLHGETQAVIKPLGKLFRGLPGLLGTTIQGSGRVAFILDVPGIVKAVLAEAETSSGRRLRDDVPRVPAAP